MTRLYEDDCLHLIAAGDEDGLLDAFDLLKRELPLIERRFKRVDKALIDLLAEVQTVFPDALYYTASGGFTLMLGSPHASDNRLTSQQQLIALVGNASIGDGDF
jgi:hypothetical protein